MQPAIPTCDSGARKFERDQFDSTRAAPSTGKLALLSIVFQEAKRPKGPVDIGANKLLPQVGLSRPTAERKA